MSFEEVHDLREVGSLGVGWNRQSDRFEPPVFLFCWLFFLRSFKKKSKKLGSFGGDPNLNVFCLFSL